VGVINDPVNGASFYGSQTFSPASGDSNITQVQVGFNLHANSANLASDALPTALNLANFPVFPTLDISAAPKIYPYPSNNWASEITGVIQSVQVLSEPVPEPGTWLIFGVAFVGYLGVRRVRAAGHP
jgi:PEP-CTERM motif